MPGSCQTYSYESTEILITGFGCYRSLIFIWHLTDGVININTYVSLYLALNYTQS